MIGQSEYCAECHSPLGLAEIGPLCESCTDAPTKLGRELQVGDIVEVWWAPGRDQVRSLRPLTGPLADLFDGEGRMAEFAVNRTGMTIEPLGRYRVFGNVP